jgi:Secretion system C-terminal sorting domain
MKKSTFILLFVFLFSSGFSQDNQRSSDLIERFKEGKTLAKSNDLGIHSKLWLSPILQEAFVHFDELNEEAKLLFQPYFERPILSGTEETYTYKNFVFHYTTDGPDGESIDPTDSNSDGVPDYIYDMSLIFGDFVYSKIHEQAGYTVPPNDDDMVDGAYYDVYISGDEAGDGVYGYVASLDDIGDNLNSTNLTELDASTSYMVMRNEYSSFGDPEKALSVTAAHEYMHAVQNGYSSSMDAWFMEASASWTEEFVYPGYDDNFQYLEGIFRSPDVALNLSDGEDPDFDGHWYSSWIFVQFFSEHTSNAAVKSVFERCIEEYALVALEQELSENWSSSFAEMFKNFVYANLMMASDASFDPYTYARAEDYETFLEDADGLKFEHDFMYSGTDLTFDSKTDGNDQLMRISADYFHVMTDMDFMVILSGDDDEAEVDFSMVKYNETSNAFEIQPSVETNEGLAINVKDADDWDQFFPILIRLDAEVEDIMPLDYIITVTEADETTSINNTLASTSQIFPNPTNNELNIKVVEYENKFIEVYDITGKLMFHSELESEITKIETSSFDEGLYFINILKNMQLISLQKFIIKH